MSAAIAEFFRHPWIETLLVALVATLLIVLGYRVWRLAVRRWAPPDTMMGLVIGRTERATTLATHLLALQVVWSLAPGELALIGAVRHVNAVLLVIALTWVVASGIDAAADAILRRQRVDTPDNLRARSVLTQTRVLSRTLIFIVSIIGVALALMTFPGVRHIGSTLLTSAGVSALIVGLAARSVVGNLLAGVQIALTQPIRHDDVLVVEGEWGRVEEITATYVVVRIWDQRRLVLPLQYFIEKPFLNWTRRSSEILGTVYLWVDYRMPVEPMRVEAQRLCQDDKDWDRRVCVVQVTDANERAMQLRILVSSADSGRNFDLRCRVREGLIAMIRSRYVEYMPRVRAEISSGPGGYQRDPAREGDQAAERNPDVDTAAPQESPTPERVPAPAQDPRATPLP